MIVGRSTFAAFILPNNVNPADGSPNRPMSVITNAYQFGAIPSRADCLIGVRGDIELNAKVVRQHLPNGAVVF